MLSRAFTGVLLSIGAIAHAPRAFAQIWPAHWDYVNTRSTFGAAGTHHRDDPYSNPLPTQPIPDMDPYCSISLYDFFRDGEKRAAFLENAGNVIAYKGGRKVLGPMVAPPWPYDLDKKELRKFVAGASDETLERMRSSFHNENATHRSVPSASKEELTNIGKIWNRAVNGPNSVGDAFDPQKAVMIGIYPEHPDKTLYRAGTTAIVYTADDGHGYVDTLLGTKRKAWDTSDQDPSWIVLRGDYSRWKKLTDHYDKFGWLHLSPSGSHAANVAMHAMTGIPVPPPFPWSPTGLKIWARLIQSMGVRSVEAVHFKPSGVPGAIDILVLGVGASIGASIGAQWVGMLKVRLDSGRMDQIIPPDDGAAQGRSSLIREVPVQPAMTIQYVPQSQFSEADRQALPPGYQNAFGRPNAQ